MSASCLMGRRRRRELQYRAHRAAVKVVPTSTTKSTTGERLLTDASPRGESADVFGDMPNDLGLLHAWDGRAPSPAPTQWCSRQPDEIVPRTKTMAWQAPSGDSCQDEKPQRVPGALRPLPLLRAQQANPVLHAACRRDVVVRSRSSVSGPEAAER